MQAYEFPIERGHVMAFARSLGDDNPIYHDADYAAATELRSLIAPPTFTQCAARFAPPPEVAGHRPREDATTTGAAPSSAGSELHAEQHFVYLRPVRVGETLVAASRPGTSWTKVGRRGGVLTFTESFTDFRDADGNMVVAARTVAVRTSR